MKIFLIALTLIALFLKSGRALSESVDSLDGLVRSPHTSSTGSPDQGNHWYSNPKLLAGIKSSNSLGKMSVIGQNIRSREEIFLGVRTPRGWGISAMISDTTKINTTGNSNPSGSVTGQSRRGKKGLKDQTTTDGTNSGGLPPSPADSNGYGDFSNRSGVGDPNVAISHPIYAGETNSLSGLFRQSFPTSDYSRSQHSWISGYYLVLSTRIAKYKLSNSLMFHYISRDEYVAPSDTTLSTGVTTSISRHFAKWFRAGFGQRVQADNHMQGPVAESGELFSSCDFLLSPTVFAGPRVHFPVFSNNMVSLDGTPATPAIANISAEFYLQAAL